MSTSHDFRIEDHGSLSLLYPFTDAARAWVAEHLPADALTHGGAIVIEPRYVADIAFGISDDGLTVQLPGEDQ